MDAKGLSIRLHGKTKAHVRRAAESCGLVINKYFRRDDGTYYGYGNTLDKYDTTPSKREQENKD